MTTFTTQNTEGFSPDELDEMNAAFTALSVPTLSADERKTLCERIIDASYGKFTVGELVARLNVKESTS